MGTSNFSRAIPRPFGLANSVTALRAAYAVALLCYSSWITALGVAPNGALRWVWVAVALVALALDGIDGALARRLGQVTTFGARFDMETDAATLFGLAWLVWASGQAGPWVLASGLMRYIFILARWVWPALAAPLPPRAPPGGLRDPDRRRSSSPWRRWSPVGVATSLCLAGLALLGYSFAVDVAWLVRRARENEDSERKRL